MSGVAAIWYAQEFQNVYASAQRDRTNGVPWFSFYKADRRVTCFYFYIWDEDFGPAFIKIRGALPVPGQGLHLMAKALPWYPLRVLADLVPPTLGGWAR